MVALELVPEVKFGDPKMVDEALLLDRLQTVSQEGAIDKHHLSHALVPSHGQLTYDDHRCWGCIGMVNKNRLLFVRAKLGPSLLWGLRLEVI